MELRKKKIEMENEKKNGIVWCKSATAKFKMLCENELLE